MIKKERDNRFQIKKLEMISSFPDFWKFAILNNALISHNQPTSQQNRSCSDDDGVARVNRISRGSSSAIFSVANIATGVLVALLFSSFFLTLFLSLFLPSPFIFSFSFSLTVRNVSHGATIHRRESNPSVAPRTKERTNESALGGRFFKNKMAAADMKGTKKWGTRGARVGGWTEETRGEEIAAAVDGGMNRRGPPESPFCD